MHLKKLNYKELSKEFGLKESTLQKYWHMYPHYFITGGSDLKSARFDLHEVITFLKEHNSGIPKLHRERREVPRPIQTQGKNLQSRCKNKKGGRGLESGNNQRINNGREEGDNRFDVFRNN